MKLKTMFILVVLSVSLMLSVSAAFAVPATWKGYVRINGALAATGTVVSAYVNNAFVVSTTVGAVAEPGLGYYIIHVEGSQNDNVTFYLNGVAVSGVNSSAQPWLLGIHPGIAPSDVFNLTMSTLASGQACRYSDACSGGYCCNGASEINSITGSGTCQASACSAGASSSSGDGPPSSGSASVSETKTLAKIEGGGTGTFTFSKGDSFAITDILITVSDPVTGGSVQVLLAIKPMGSPDPISPSLGKVYKYLLITKSGIPDASVKGITIKFKISKAWFTENGLDPLTVALRRYVDGKWVKLVTKKASEDATSFYYEAVTPGFSYFAITAEKIGAAAPTGGVTTEPSVPSEAASCSDGVQNQGETGTDCGGPCSACPASPPAVPDAGTGKIEMKPVDFLGIAKYAAIIALLACGGVLGYVLYRRGTRGRGDSIDELERKVFGLEAERKARKEKKQ